MVRLVGTGVEEFLAGHVERSPAANRCVHTILRDGDQIIDDCVIVLHGVQTTADISLHGGPWILRRVLDLLERTGFHIDHLSQKLLSPYVVDADSAIEREVLRYIPQARTEQSLRSLLAQPAAWRKLAVEELCTVVPAILSDDGLFWLLHPPRVAIAGTPNSGKSTLANRLFAQERSITADAPGTTRDWVGEMTDIDGLAVMLIDTPGLRPITERIEATAIESGGRELNTADLVIVVLDATADPAEQARVVELFPRGLRILNKCDLAMPPWAIADGAIETIATTDHGLEGVRNAIRRRFNGIDSDYQRPRWWTDEQRGILQASLTDPQRLVEYVSASNVPGSI